MRTIIPKPSSHEPPSPSSNKKNLKWVMRRGGGGGGGGRRRQWKDEEEEAEEMLAPSSVSAPSSFHPPTSALSRFRSAVMAAFLASRHNRSAGLGGGMGSRVTGTLYGHRRGHVHLSFQVDPKAPPVVLLELATPTAALVREMASGLVRIALECERKAAGGNGRRLVEEGMWRAYCNGRKCGYAVRRECGPGDWEVLRAVGPVSMGAGVLPAAAAKGEGGDGEVMYMRARFERVVGSRDSEAFYMMNPDGGSGGGTELSIYFLRV